MPIIGLSHITLVVRDRSRTVRLFVDALGGREIFRSEGESSFSLYPESFIILGSVWLAIMENQQQSHSRSYDHIAFRISEKDLDLSMKRLVDAGVELLPSRRRHPGEDRSVYFYDFDNHLIELHTGTLKDRLNAYRMSLYRCPP